MPGFEVVGKEERDALVEIFDNDNGILFAHGFDALRHNRFRVREFEKAFAERLGAPHAQAVCSGSAALLVGLKALGIGPGDEVITQAHTFVATVEAILLCGAVPVITEIDGTYNMDPEDLAKKITAKTRAIIPVHMAGVAARMDKILSVARSSGIAVLEDTAQGIGAKFGGKHLGTLGDVGTFSLDFGKTITTGEGGMVLSNSKDVHFEAMAFHDHGHEYNPTVGRADDTRHGWGFNFRMSEMNAAVGLVQLRKLDELLRRARKNKESIKTRLKSLPQITFREIPEGSEENYDSIIFSYADRHLAEKALLNLRASGLGTKNIPDALRWHFAGYWEHMLNGTPYEKTFEGAWPRSRDLLERSVALPVMVNWDDAFIEAYAEKALAALDVKG